uniref:Uncharacterized protein n=1 Tax=Picocystis salinarum TaxID=88271 RepID=A0A7S3UGJ4_9CHLO
MELCKVMQTYARQRKREEETVARIKEKEGDRIEAALHHLCKLLKIPREKDGSYDVAETCCAEFFMEFSLPKAVVALPCLTSLRKLVVVNCSLSTLPPLGKLLQLERADFTDNKITSLPQGLQEKQMTLRELTLDSNLLNTLDGVDSFPGLRYLSASENRIASEKGVDRLPRLEKLNLAGNCIQHVSLAGYSYGKIKMLDLSGNPIALLHETANLAALADLVEVHFSSQECGACPIAHHPSYFYYLIFHLPRIRRIDSFVLGKHSRQLAEAGYLETLWNGEFCFQDQSVPDMTELEEIERRISLLTSQHCLEPSSRSCAESIPQSIDTRKDMEDISWIQYGEPDLIGEDVGTPIEQVNAAIWTGSETPSSSLSNSLDNIAINFTDAELDQMRRKIDEEVNGYRGCVPYPLPRSVVSDGRINKSSRSRKVPMMAASTSSSSSLKSKDYGEPTRSKACKKGNTPSNDSRKHSKSQKNASGNRAKPSSKRNAEGPKMASPGRPQSTWSGRFGSPASREL